MHDLKREAEGTGKKKSRRWKGKTKRGQSQTFGVKIDRLSRQGRVLKIGHEENA